MTRTKRQKVLSGLRVAGWKAQKKGNCPTPDKQRYATLELAIPHAIKSSKHSRAVEIYKCDCGGYHIKKKKR